MKIMELVNGAKDAAQFVQAAETSAEAVKRYVWDARGNGQGGVSPTLTGDHENRVTDYTAIVCEEQRPPRKRKYIVRRLTPLECGRLQGFPDGWGCVSQKAMLPEQEASFWENVRKTHAEAMGKKYKAFKTPASLLKWVNGLHTDSAEYKMWGNGIALPCAVYVMEGVAEALREQKSN